MKSIFENGRIYVGKIKEDKIEGQGKMIYGNGDIYDEEFKNKIIGMKKEN
jgi:hypothetical protein